MNFSGTILVIMAILKYYCITANEELALRVNKSYDDCFKELNINNKDKKDFLDGNFDKMSESGKCFVDCFAKRMDIITNTGINFTKLVEFYEYLWRLKPEDLNKLDSIVNNCIPTSYNGKTDCEKALNAYVCLRKGAIENLKH
ncbi:uncharacterized protein LOC129606521 [Condylostylus longicornis]|uniref:uncharacterized protein LOC129606521 n=1 Tax=Condylostylus longicornis TaxID=2530218 RepID=UPI00244DEE6A|nr:uncharacterized protein LOC129606521 [Condylostylus longicornis]